MAPARCGLLHAVIVTTDDPSNQATVTITDSTFLSVTGGSFSKTTQHMGTVTLNTNYADGIGVVNRSGVDVRVTILFRPDPGP